MILPFELGPRSNSSAGSLVFEFASATSRNAAVGSLAWSAGTGAAVASAVVVVAVVVRAVAVVVVAVGAAVAVLVKDNEF